MVLPGDGAQLQPTRRPRLQRLRAVCKKPRPPLQRVHCTDVPPPPTTHTAGMVHQEMGLARSKLVFATKVAADDTRCLIGTVYC
jgi:hypothetical protein